MKQTKKSRLWLAAVEVPHVPVAAAVAQAEEDKS